MNREVDLYLVDGCGRCKLYQTPECKVHTFAEELKALRAILLRTELTEELKWSQPCYTYDGANVLLLTTFKDRCVLSFLKGSLMKDPAEILEKPGEHSRAGRFIRFTSLARVEELESVIFDYVTEAIEIEKAGLKVDFEKGRDIDYPEELQEMFDEDPPFEDAFDALTPGRRRGYLIHFTGAKQSKTRSSRIEKSKPKIFEGKGFHDR